jgi:CRP/FNR family cyclic AMP-dependent transcriptional regulator
MRAKPKAARVPPLPITPVVASLLALISEGKHVLTFPKGERIFAQGESADAIFFIETGKVKISVVSAAGKEAVLVMLGPPSFFGEGALVGQTVRIATAKALEATTVFRIDKSAMITALQNRPGLSEKFIAALLTRNIDLEEDLCDQLFNHSEKRLARVLLKLTRLREHDVLPDARIPLLSHETLAEMVGTTRSRITHFMNKFQKLGLVDYRNGGFTVKTEMLTDVVLHD